MLNSAFGDHLRSRCAFGDFLQFTPARRRAYLINDRRARPVPESDASSGNSGDHRFVDHVGVAIRSRTFAVEFRSGHSAEPRSSPPIVDQLSASTCGRELQNIPGPARLRAHRDRRLSPDVEFNIEHQTTGPVPGSSAAYSLPAEVGSLSSPGRRSPTSGSVGRASGEC